MEPESENAFCHDGHPFGPADSQLDIMSQLFALSRVYPDNDCVFEISSIFLKEERCDNRLLVDASIIAKD